MRLIGFDSFEGLPTEAKTDDAGYWSPRMFKADIRITKWFLDRAAVGLVARHACGRVVQRDVERRDGRSTPAKEGQPHHGRLRYVPVRARSARLLRSF